MHRVDFYILNTDSHQQRMQFAAKLGEKAFNNGLKTIYWLDDQAEEAEALSNTLWALRPESFLAHDIISDQAIGQAPISVYSGAKLPSNSDSTYLINLSSHPLTSGISSERAAEVVIQTPAVLKITRTRYAQYKRLCENVLTHKM